MTFASLLAIWMALFAIGIAVVYRIALRIERWSPAMSLASLVLLGPVVLIASWMATHQITRVDQAKGPKSGPVARYVAYEISR
jgi:hypothetical protein